MTAWQISCQTLMDNQAASLARKTKAAAVYTGRMRPCFQYVAPLLADILDWLSAHDIRAELACAVEIALAEALNNVVEHGRLTASQRIEVLARITETGLLVAIFDKGLAYPDGMIPENTPPDINELPEGGFGWMLIHSLTNELTYRRNAGTNILTLQFDRQ